jgi:hypothetical protein
MSVNSEQETVVQFAPAPRGQADAHMVADDSGRTIMAMLQKAADMAKEDCARAMDLAHKLSFQLRAAEERARELEAEAAYFRDRAGRAEAATVSSMKSAQSIPRVGVPHKAVAC